LSATRPPDQPSSAAEQLSAALAVLAGVGVVAPLLAGPLPATHDGLHHLFRLFELDRSLRAWHLFPRVFADMGFGYGYPVLNFYSPLSYYLAWLGTAIGIGYIGGLKAAYVLGAVAAALAMYAWARTFLPAAGAFLAAAAYSYMPYHVADVLVRGALAEATAFVWPPLLLWLLTRFCQRRAPVYLVWLAAGLAGFILTHNLTALMFAPFLLLYALLLFGLPRRRPAITGYGALAVAAAAGLGIAAFYWLPAALEVRYVLAGTVGGMWDLLSLLQPLGHWVSPYILHRYTPFQGVAGQHPLGLVQTASAILGLVALGLAWRASTRLLRVAGACALAAALASMALLTPASSWLWSNLPGLSYLQFPWRLQAVVGLGTSVLIGCVCLLPLPRFWAWAASLALLLGLNALLGLRLEPAHLPTAAPPLREEQVSLDGLLDYDFQTALWLREYGGEWLLEYLPVWALGERERFFLPTDQPEALPPLPAASRVTVVEDAPLRTRLRVSLPQPATLVFHRFYFPGWQVVADGRAQPTRPLGRLGLVAADLPAGEYDVAVRLDQTAPRLAGLALSALGAPGLLVWAVRKRQRAFLSVSAGLAALFLSLVAARAWRYPTIHRPLPLRAQVGDAAELAGYAIERRGDGSDVWLYWLALAPRAQNYKAFVHAVGEGGEMLGQHDSQPGNEFTPTTRWLPGELVPDRHALPSIAVPTALYAGMYTWPDVANLPVLQDDQDVPERRVALGSLARR